MSHEPYLGNENRSAELKHARERKEPISLFGHASSPDLKSINDDFQRSYLLLFGLLA